MRRSLTVTVLFHLSAAAAHIIGIQNLCSRTMRAHFSIPAGAGMINTTVSHIDIGSRADFEISASSNNRKITFAAWIDDDIRAGTHPAAKTGSLVEATIDEEAQTIWTDISNVDAFSNTWTIVPPAGCKNVSNGTSCRPIGCSLPSDWECPFDNQVGKVGRAKDLRDLQTCLSNCTLHDTDEACCRGPYSDPLVCRNHNPALKAACPQAYSYAFDDQTSLFHWSWAEKKDGALLLLQSCT